MLCHLGLLCFPFSPSFSKFGIQLPLLRAFIDDVTIRRKVKANQGEGACGRGGEEENYYSRTMGMCEQEVWTKWAHTPKMLPESLHLKMLY